MDLLEKFNAVEVTPQNRITESDKDYCERHQAAYEAAAGGYAELMRIWTSINEKQEECMGEESDRKRHMYLCARDDLMIREYSVNRHIENLPSKFISDIVGYFCDTYSISISSYAIEQALLKETGAANDESAAATSALRYESIVDRIFQEMDGRNFAEYAMYQLKRDCLAAVDFIRSNAYFERKKAVIRFHGSFCDYTSRSDWGYNSGYLKWTLTSKMKSIAKALSYLEKGAFGTYPLAVEQFLANKYSCSEYVILSDCEKLEEMKMYKNGRVDVKFASAALASEFEETYLKKAA